MKIKYQAPLGATDIAFHKMMGELLARGPADFGAVKRNGNEWVIPPTVSDVARDHRLDLELANEVAKTSTYVVLRKEIGGDTIAVTHIKQFVNEVRKIRKAQRNAG